MNLKKILTDPKTVLAGVVGGPHEGDWPVADVNQAGVGFVEENDGITNAREPGPGSNEDLVLQHVQQGLHQIVQIFRKYW